MRYETIQKDGKSFVMLPLKEFNRLKEDAEMIDDIKAYDAAMAAGGEYFPDEVINALVEGENPVKIYREYRHMTQEKLAVKAKISRAYLAQIETRKKKGSITALKNIAKALGVDIDDLV